MIRPYGPGKFDTIMDSIVYGASLDGGPDEECGSVQELGWYGLLHTPILNDEERHKLTAEELRLIDASAGCILSEDSNGFVNVEYFDTKAALMSEWRETCDSVGGDEE